VVTREQRVATSIKVEFKRLGELILAESEDISRHGTFVRTWAFLPVGDIVELTLYLPLGVCRMISRVVHILSEGAARALGRHPGMGFEFLEGNRERRALLKRYLDDLIEEVTPPPQALPSEMRVLVVESNPRLADRLRSALADDGFTVDTAANGAEAYSACLTRAPDAILAADIMPVMDGWSLVRMLNARPGLSEVPVFLMSDDASDLTRLNAYRLGVRDFIQKPFTDDELCLRMRRLYRPGRSTTAGVILRGSVGEISLAMLLSLLEFERKSGLLFVMRASEVARLFVAHGRVVKVEAGGPATEPARARLLRVLDWKEGQFEFTACEVVGNDEVGLATQHVLLEHARVRDERDKGKGGKGS